MVIRCAYLGLLVADRSLHAVVQRGRLRRSGGAGQGFDASLPADVVSATWAGGAALADFHRRGDHAGRDSQTYDILLSTPLTNGQIVLGSLLSRVFFVVALLVSGIPIFAVTQIFGGVAISSIVYSFLIAASTAMVTGAMAMAIATFKIGTRRTIFSFYLFIMIYLVGGYLLDRVDFFHLTYTDASGSSDADVDELADGVSSVSGAAGDFQGQGVHAAQPGGFAGGVSVVADELALDEPGDVLLWVHVFPELRDDGAVGGVSAAAGAIDDEHQGLGAAKSSPEQGGPNAQSRGRSGITRSPGARPRPRRRPRGRRSCGMDSLSWE